MSDINTAQDAKAPRLTLADRIRLQNLQTLRLGTHAISIGTGFSPLMPTVPLTTSTFTAAAANTNSAAVSTTAATPLVDPSLFGTAPISPAVSPRSNAVFSVSPPITTNAVANDGKGSNKKATLQQECEAKKSHNGNSGVVGKGIEQFVTGIVALSSNTNASAVNSNSNNLSIRRRPSNASMSHEIYSSAPKTSFTSTAADNTKGNRELETLESILGIILVGGETALPIADKGPNSALQATTSEKQTKQKQTTARVKQKKSDGAASSAFPTLSSLFETRGQRALGNRGEDNNQHTHQHRHRLHDVFRSGGGEIDFSLAQMASASATDGLLATPLQPRASYHDRFYSSTANSPSERLRSFDDSTRADHMATEDDKEEEERTSEIPPYSKKIVTSLSVVSGGGASRNYHRELSTEDGERLFDKNGDAQHSSPHDSQHQRTASSSYVGVIMPITAFKPAVMNAYGIDTLTQAEEERERGKREVEEGSSSSLCALNMGGDAEMKRGGGECTTTDAHPAETGATIHSNNKSKNAAAAVELAAMPSVVALSTTSVFQHLTQFDRLNGIGVISSNMNGIVGGASSAATAATAAGPPIVTSEIDLLAYYYSSSAESSMATLIVNDDEGNDSFDERDDEDDEDGDDDEDGNNDDDNAAQHNTNDEPLVAFVDDGYFGRASSNLGGTTTKATTMSASSHNFADYHLHNRMASVDLSVLLGIDFDVFEPPPTTPASVWGGGSTNATAGNPLLSSSPHDAAACHHAHQRGKDGGDNTVKERQQSWEGGGLDTSTAEMVMNLWSYMDADEACCGDGEEEEESASPTSNNANMLNSMLPAKSHGNCPDNRSSAKEATDRLRGGSNSHSTTEKRGISKKKQQSAREGSSVKEKENASVAVSIKPIVATLPSLYATFGIEEPKPAKSSHSSSSAQPCAAAMGTASSSPPAAVVSPSPTFSYLAAVKGVNPQTYRLAKYGLSSPLPSLCPEPESDKPTNQSTAKASPSSSLSSPSGEQPPGLTSPHWGVVPFPPPSSRPMGDDDRPSTNKKEKASAATSAPHGDGHEQKRTEGKAATDTISSAPLHHHHGHGGGIYSPPSQHEHQQQLQQSGSTTSILDACLRPAAASSSDPHARTSQPQERTQQQQQQGTNPFPQVFSHAASAGHQQSFVVHAPAMPGYIYHQHAAPFAAMPGPSLMPAAPPPTYGSTLYDSYLHYYYQQAQYNFYYNQHVFAHASSVQAASHPTHHHYHPQQQQQRHHTVAQSGPFNNNKLPASHTADHTTATMASSDAPPATVEKKTKAKKSKKAKSAPLNASATPFVVEKTHEHGQSEDKVASATPADEADVEGEKDVHAAEKEQAVKEEVEIAVADPAAIQNGYEGESAKEEEEACVKMQSPAGEEDVEATTANGASKKKRKKKKKTTAEPADVEDEDKKDKAVVKKFERPINLPPSLSPRLPLSNHATIMHCLRLAHTFKTSLCVRHLRGLCRSSAATPHRPASSLDGLGAYCHFAHSLRELRTFEQNVVEGLYTEAAIDVFRRVNRFLQKRRLYYLDVPVPRNVFIPPSLLLSLGIDVSVAEVPQNSLGNEGLSATAAATAPLTIDCKIADGWRRVTKAFAVTLPPFGAASSPNSPKDLASSRSPTAGGGAAHHPPSPVSLQSPAEGANGSSVSPTLVRREYAFIIPADMDPDTIEDPTITKARRRQREFEEFVAAVRKAAAEEKEAKGEEGAERSPLTSGKTPTISPPVVFGASALSEDEAASISAAVTMESLNISPALSATGRGLSVITPPMTASQQLLNATATSTSLSYTPFWLPTSQEATTTPHAANPTASNGVIVWAIRDLSRCAGDLGHIAALFCEAKEELVETGAVQMSRFPPAVSPFPLTAAATTSTTHGVLEASLAVIEGMLARRQISTLAEEQTKLLTRGSDKAASEPLAIGGGGDVVHGHDDGMTAQPIEDKSRERHDADEWRIVAGRGGLLLSIPSKSGADDFSGDKKFGGPLTDQRQFDYHTSHCNEGRTLIAGVFDVGSQISVVRIGSAANNGGVLILPLERGGGENGDRLAPRKARERKRHHVHQSSIDVPSSAALSAPSDDCAPLSTHTAIFNEDARSSVRGKGVSSSVIRGDNGKGNHRRDEEEEEEEEEGGAADMQNVATEEDSPTHPTTQTTAEDIRGDFNDDGGGGLGDAMDTELDYASDRYNNTDDGEDEDGADLGVFKHCAPSSNTLSKANDLLASYDAPNGGGGSATTMTTTAACDMAAMLTPDNSAVSTPHVSTHHRRSVDESRGQNTSGDDDLSFRPRHAINRRMAETDTETEHTVAGSHRQRNNEAKGEGDDDGEEVGEEEEAEGPWSATSRALLGCAGSMASVNSSLLPPPQLPKTISSSDDLPHSSNMSAVLMSFLYRTCEDSRNNVGCLPILQARAVCPSSLVPTTSTSLSPNGPLGEPSPMIGCHHADGKHPSLFAEEAAEQIASVETPLVETQKVRKHRGRRGGVKHKKRKEREQAILSALSSLAAGQEPLANIPAAFQPIDMWRAVVYIRSGNHLTHYAKAIIAKCPPEHIDFLTRGGDLTVPPDMLEEIQKLMNIGNRQGGGGRGDDEDDDDDDYDCDDGCADAGEDPANGAAAAAQAKKKKSDRKAKRAPKHTAAAADDDDVDEAAATAVFQEEEKDEVNAHLSAAQEGELDDHDTCIDRPIDENDDHHDHAGENDSHDDRCSEIADIDETQSACIDNESSFQHHTQSAATGRSPTASPSVPKESRTTPTASSAAATVSTPAAIVAEKISNGDSPHKSSPRIQLPQPTATAAATAPMLTAPINTSNTSQCNTTTYGSIRTLHNQQRVIETEQTQHEMKRIRAQNVLQQQNGPKKAAAVAASPTASPSSPLHHHGCPKSPSTTTAVATPIVESMTARMYDRQQHHLRSQVQMQGCHHHPSTGSAATNTGGGTITASTVANASSQAGATRLSATAAPFEKQRQQQPPLQPQQQLRGGALIGGPTQPPPLVLTNGAVIGGGGVGGGYTFGRSSQFQSQIQQVHQQQQQQPFHMFRHVYQFQQQQLQRAGFGSGIGGQQAISPSRLSRSSTASTSPSVTVHSLSQSPWLAAAHHPSRSPPLLPSSNAHSAAGIRRKEERTKSNANESSGAKKNKHGGGAEEELSSTHDHDHADEDVGGGVHDDGNCLCSNVQQQHALPPCEHEDNAYYPPADDEFLPATSITPTEEGGGGGGGHHHDPHCLFSSSSHTNQNNKGYLYQTLHTGDSSSRGTTPRSVFQHNPYGLGGSKILGTATAAQQSNQQAADVSPRSSSINSSHFHHQRLTSAFGGGGGDGRSPSQQQLSISNGGGGRDHPHHPQLGPGGSSLANSPTNLNSSGVQFYNPPAYDSASLWHPTTSAAVPMSSGGGGGSAKAYYHRKTDSASSFHQHYAAAASHVTNNGRAPAMGERGGGGGNSVCSNPFPPPQLSPMSSMESLSVPRFVPSTFYVPTTPPNHSSLNTSAKK